MGVATGASSKVLIETISVLILSWFHHDDQNFLRFFTDVSFTYYRVRNIRKFNIFSHVGKNTNFGRIKWMNPGALKSPSNFPFAFASYFQVLETVLEIDLYECTLFYIFHSGFPISLDVKRKPLAVDEKWMLFGGRSLNRILLFIHSVITIKICGKSPALCSFISDPFGQKFCHIYVLYGKQRTEEEEYHPQLPMLKLLFKHPSRCLTPHFTLTFFLPASSVKSVLY